MRLKEDETKEDLISAICHTVYAITTYLPPAVMSSSDESANNANKDMEPTNNQSPPDKRLKMMFTPRKAKT
eukprot:scaffold63326_cov72-Cyclotella_meneghiniana.AAC.8